MVSRFDIIDASAGSGVGEFEAAESAENGRRLLAVLHGALDTMNDVWPMFKTHYEAIEALRAENAELRARIEGQEVRLSVQGEYMVHLGTPGPPC